MSETIRFDVEWDGYAWVAGHDSGGVTQAKNLDRLRANCVEVVKLMLDRDVEPGDVDLHFTLDDPELAPDVAETIRSLRGEVEAISDRLATTTATTILRLASNGFPMRDIAHVVGMSHQRVGQILEEQRKARRHGPVRGQKRRSRAS